MTARPRSQAHPQAARTGTIRSRSRQRTGSERTRRRPSPSRSATDPRSPVRSLRNTKVGRHGNVINNHFRVSCSVDLRRCGDPAEWAHVHRRDGDGTATIAGTPAANTEGEVVVHLTASNGVGTDATQSLDLEVGIAPVVRRVDHTTFTVGTAGTFTVTGTRLSRRSRLRLRRRWRPTSPQGVTFVDDHDMTATLAGTPALGTGGTYSIDITAHNGTVPNAVQHFTLSVDEPPAITSADSAQFQAGVASSRFR